MYKSTEFACLVCFFLLIFHSVPIKAQAGDTLFYDSFEDMTNWMPVGPQGMQNWSVTNTNIAGGNASPEVQFTWEYLFVGESYLLASPVFNGVDGHNLELKFDYYEDYWSNIVYVGVAITGDGGTTYNSIWELQANGNSGPEEITVDFTGIANMQIALYYLGDANDIDFWYVDDVTLIDMDAVPVELSTFTAQALNGNVVLNWTTGSETNNKGFEIQSKKSDEVNKVSDWKAAGFVDGSGTTTKAVSYTFTDKNIEEGFYSYRLKQIDFDGTVKYSNAIEVKVINPSDFTLMQNYPNPFNPSTLISFELPVESGVSLNIYDLLGQNVKSLIKESLPAGSHSIQFNASGLNSGIYFYRVEAEGKNGQRYTGTRKMMLIK